MTVSAPADPIAPYLHAVEKLIAQQQFEQAATQLNGIAKAAPNDARVHLMGGRLAEASGNTKGAIESARRAVAMAPGWSVATMELALALARANQFAEALPTAEKAIQLDPDNLSVLGRAIDVAHRAQHFDVALLWLRRAAAMAPQNMDVKRMIARDLRLKKNLPEALAAYDQLLQASADDHVARLGHLQTALDMGKPELAREDAKVLLAAFPDNAEIRYWEDVANGRTPSRQPAEMVQAMYEGFAGVYDMHVLKTLKYQLPWQVAERIKQWHPDLALNVLDLGCGTGLLGVALGRINGALIGVDLSKPMTDQAMRHGVYDRFHHVDVHDALDATPESLYDVIAALDVFIYAGELTKAIPDALRILKPGGRLVLSFERADDTGPDLVLLPSQRYAHKAAAVEALCRSAGFASVELEPITIREEEGQPVAGMLLVARKAG
jgi:predicted TPR repeat methyltransferase